MFPHPIVSLIHALRQQLRRGVCDMFLCVRVCAAGCFCVYAQRENVLTAVLWFWACPLEVAINPERSALTVSAVQPMNGY